jgi:hypothetical protein
MFFSLLASLFGPFNTANFKLASEAGDTIQTVSLARGNPDAATSVPSGVPAGTLTATFTVWEAPLASVKRDG